MNPYTSSGSVATMAANVSGNDKLNDLGDGGKASILASVEPVVASLVGILVFGEPMGIGTLVGLVCILVSIYILR